MMVSKENELYENVVDWLNKYLKNKYKNIDKILTKNTSTFLLSDFLDRENLLKYIPAGETFKIKIDVTGVVIKKSQIKLIIIEVKKNYITLKDLAQTLGYCKVVNPEIAILTSPKGWSNIIHKLIITYKREDLLKYDFKKTILIAKWDLNSNSIREGDYLIR